MIVFISFKTYVQHNPFLRCQNFQHLVCAYAAVLCSNNLYAVMQTHLVQLHGYLTHYTSQQNHFDSVQSLYKAFQY